MLHVILELAGKNFVGKLHSLSSSSLSLLCSPHLDIPPRAFLDRVLIDPDGRNIVLLQVRTIDVSSDEQRTVVRLHVDDPKSQSLLWALANEDPHDIPFHKSAEPEEAPSSAAFSKRGLSRSRGRLQWVEEAIGYKLTHLSETRLDAARLRGNIENFVGTVEIPVGLAGPLLFKGQFAQGQIMAPFATTEGALVASVSRGAKALTESGGVSTRVLHQRMVRGPVFTTPSVEDAVQLLNWIQAHVDEIRLRAQAGSRHARLIALEPILIGRSLHVRFVYETGDAAGQNMTTLCTWRACQWIRAQIAHYPNIQIDNFFIEANTSGDKKASWLNYVSGRGIRVTAGVLIPHDVLERVLKVSLDSLMRASYCGIQGTMAAGMLGISSNIANVTAAIFTATGQDIGSVFESSAGQFHLEPEGDGVFASILLPSLVIGTIGGGTNLPTQSDSLRILGCHGEGKVSRLAEIIAGFALALEVSTLCAIAAGNFATAHERLGRSKQSDGLRESDLDTAFFHKALRPTLCADPDTLLQIEAFRPTSLDAQDSILSDLTAAGLRKKVGLFPYEVDWRIGWRTGKTRVVVKSKATDVEVLSMMGAMAQLCGHPYAAIFESYKLEIGFRNCHVRELAICELTDPRFTRIAPTTYATLRHDPDAENPRAIYLIAMEAIDCLSHLNTANHPDRWSDLEIRIVLSDIASFHAIYLNQTQKLVNCEWLDNMSADRMQRLSALWRTMLDYNRLEHPEIYTESRVEILNKAIENIHSLWQKIEAAPLTLIHNDFNLRNIALRTDGETSRLCAYDWELATVHVPQRDICEFLAFVLPPGTPMALRFEYVEYHRQKLEEAAQVHLDQAQWREIFDLSCIDFAIHRLALLSIADSFKAYDYLARVQHAHFELIDLLPSSYSVFR